MHSQATWKILSSRCVDERDGGIDPPGSQRVWRGVCARDPKIIANLIRKRAPPVKRVVFELRAEKVPAVCIAARHAKAALDWR
ncbi:hypothetical protein MesoLj113a_72700 [Mesorhizobium sp. 113-1-2]|nr:hypothetical protein MesoLj113a_72700 [Mesorhizobium sp. 113-1-2]